MKKINKKKKAPNIIFGGIIILLFSICLMQLNNEKTKISKVNATNDINQKVEWGIKRNSDNHQPDVGNKNKELLERNGGICLGNNSEKSVYLTFDSGYEAGYMGNILDVLQQNEVKATFFITSHYLNTASDLIERMINEGHIVGNQFPPTVKDYI